MTQNNHRAMVVLNDKLSELVEGHWSASQIGVLRQQIAAKASAAELAFFLTVAKNQGLDPFKRQIHAVFRWDSRAQREIMAIQTGIDGYRALADRTGKYAGNDDPRFTHPMLPCGDCNAFGTIGKKLCVACKGAGHTINQQECWRPESASVTVHKIVASVVRPFTATARWSEYVGTKKGGAPTHMWRSKPFLMLGKCAEALALRKAFPDQLAGVYTAEEMDQAGFDSSQIVQAEVVEMPEPHPKAVEIASSTTPEEVAERAQEEIEQEERQRREDNDKLLEDLPGEEFEDDDEPGEMLF